MTRWDPLAPNYDEHLPSSELFAELREAVLRAVEPTPTDVGLDLGAGTGFLTIPLAAQISRMYAVDVSRPMLDRLGDKLKNEGLTVRACRSDLRRFTPPEKVDIIVSNYALHHLGHQQKRALLAESMSWLKPAGRIAISDLTNPWTLRPSGRAFLLGKIRGLMRKGIVGYGRMGRYALRQVCGRGEYPASLEFWRLALTDAGFESVGSVQIGRRSGVAFGRNSVT